MTASRDDDLSAYADLLAWLPAEAGQQVDAAMNEPHRRYHARWHLGRMWRLAGGFMVKSDYLPMAWMIGYHDIVYDVRASVPENELASAQEFMIACSTMDTGLSALEIREANQAIKASADHLGARKDLDNLGRLFLDLDLEPMASDFYDENTVLLREEFQWLSDKAWETGRRRFVQGLLDKVEGGIPLYGSGIVPWQWQEAALQNMHRSLTSVPKP